jgi:hypothetical protein
MDERVGFFRLAGETARPGAVVAISLPPAKAQPAPVGTARARGAAARIA